LKDEIESTCRLRKQRKETIVQIASGFSILKKNEYVMRHDKVYAQLRYSICQVQGIEKTDRWYTQTHTHTHTHTPHATHTHTHTTTHTHTYTHTQPHTHTHKNNHTHTHTHIHTKPHTQTHKTTHTHKQPHTHTHNHTHSHTNQCVKMKMLQYFGTKGTHRYRQVRANRTGTIIKYKKERTCIVVDVAII